MSSHDRVKYVYNEVATLVQTLIKEQVSKIEIAAGLAIVIGHLDVDMEEVENLAKEVGAA